MYDAHPVWNLRAVIGFRCYLCLVVFLLTVHSPHFTFSRKFANIVPLREVVFVLFLFFVRLFEHLGDDSW